jgi:hypothetical protein
LGVQGPFFKKVPGCRRQTGMMKKNIEGKKQKIREE